VKILYFDCFAGAAGDMILGALLDAGLPFDALKGALGSLAVDGIDISVDRVIKTGITATKFKVHEHAHHHGHDHGHHHHHHSLRDIESAIGRSSLSEGGKGRAIAMFRRLGEAESQIHGIPLDRIHLHEVGAIDSIIDIVGAVFALEWFAADRIVVSPLNVGGGMVTSAHGVFPVPAPATVKLLGPAPVYSSGIQSELLTPTGALILTEYASSFGPMPAMRVDRVGYGAGDREFKETPNVVRVLVGEGDGAKPQAPSPNRAPSAAAALGWKPHDVVTLECEIDDMNPQIFGVLMDKLYAAGALEVFYAPVQMKKNRPGTLMTVVARPDQREALTDLIFRESTTIGVRYQEVRRECLDREMVTVATPLGPVRFKVAHRQGRVLNAQPEFEDLAKLAADRGIAIKDVQAIALKAWLDK
jgi:uncharacterized protein (TIGR00299 family) protein